MDQALDPLRHASRRALSLRLDHGPRQARRHHRRGSAGMVLQSGDQARLPAFSRRLCRDRKRRRGRAQAHRPHAVAARDRGGQHRAPARPTASTTMSRPAAAWAARRRSICSSAACASPAPTAGAGTRRSSTPRRNTRRPATPSLIWEGHRAGREIGYCHIEKLHNLDKLPAKGFIDQLLPGEDPRRLRRLDARRRDHRLGSRHVPRTSDRHPPASDPGVLQARAGQRRHHGQRRESVGGLEPASSSSN